MGRAYHPILCRNIIRQRSIFNVHALSPVQRSFHTFDLVVRPLPAEDFLAAEFPIVDVRSPGEFNRAHIPGAIPVPLFTDQERSVIGTLYKNEGRDRAVLEGLRYIGPRMAEMVEAITAMAPDRKVRLHCWRGGERSGSVAWLLSKAGFKEVIILAGGYKAFRQQVLRSFDRPLDLRVLGGFTGTGKTLILQKLKKAGQQVIDLEHLACHKGSSFGSLGQPAQPTTEQFENLIWKELQALDPSLPIWIEDESPMIGKVRIPAPLFSLMREAPLLFLDLPLEQRAVQLVEEYGSQSRIELSAAIERIAKRLGPQHAKAALKALDDDDLYTTALITLRYYDKAYLRGQADRHPDRITRIPISRNEIPDLIERLKENVSIGI